MTPTIFLNIYIRTITTGLKPRLAYLILGLHGSTFAVSKFVLKIHQIILINAITPMALFYQIPACYYTIYAEILGIDAANDTML